MLSLKGDPEGAERNFLASLGWARRRQANLGSSARQPVSPACGRAKANAETRCQLLAPGFDTKDLPEAKERLAELR